jgi:hypothetical protein
MNAVAESVAATLNAALRQLTTYRQPHKDGVGVSYFRLGRVEKIENGLEHDAQGSPYRRTVAFSYVDEQNPNSEMQSYVELRQEVFNDEFGISFNTTIMS